MTTTNKTNATETSNSAAILDEYGVLDEGDCRTDELCDRLRAVGAEDCDVARFRVSRLAEEQDPADEEVVHRDGISIDPSSEVELSENREYAAAHKRICCARRVDEPDGGWVYYIRANSDPLVLVEGDGSLTPSEWIECCDWLVVEQIIGEIERSPADQDSKDFAVTLIRDAVADN
jgi:hypothetical protein